MGVVCATDDQKKEKSVLVKQAPVIDDLAKMTVLITGCSRGLGLGLVRGFIKAGACVIATCRSPKSATELLKAIELGASRGSCVLPCDVDSPESITMLAAAISAPATSYQGQLHTSSARLGATTPHRQHLPDKVVGAGVVAAALAAAITALAG